MQLDDSFLAIDAIHEGLVNTMRVAYQKLEARGLITMLMHYIILTSYNILAFILIMSCSAAPELPILFNNSNQNNYQYISLSNTTSASKASSYSTTAVEPAGPLHWEKDGFYDSDGRRAYFRGVNIAGNAKFPPFIPLDDPYWWDLLAGWGFNAVRLTIFWEAIEPEPSIYNRSYLHEVEKMAEQASERGIYVILDMHQDLYSRWFGGDGAPSWALNNETNNRSFLSGSQWFQGYILSRDVRASFTHFFKSDYLKEHYCKAWSEVAKSVKGNEYILGYDIMNEPSGGDLPNDAGQLENGYLKPFYLQVLDAIRQVDQDAVGFIEPDVLNMYRSKLTPFNASDLVYAPHLYNSFYQNLLQNLWNPNDQDPQFNDLLMIHEKKAGELGMPLFIGEFGTPWTTKPSSQRQMLVDQALKAMEMEFVDNIYWDYSVENVAAWNGEDFSLIDRNGQPRGLEVNVRPYLRRLKGLPLSQSYNWTSRSYLLSFRTDTGESRSIPAIIFIPTRIQYPEGFQIHISDGHCEFQPQKNELWYFPDRGGNHNITISTNH
jgi:endoglycosylceramidase